MNDYVTFKQREFIESLRNDKAYDFIARNYMEYTKEELKDIILEVLFELYLVNRNTKNYKNSLNNIIEELTDRWYLEEE